jgi:catechol 2,3-dioxygenase-like lactoylglutathione lyase family enzyme
VATSRDEAGEFIVTVTLIVADIDRSMAFYRDVLGATVVHVGEPTLLRLKYTWIIINVGGGGTDDKPDVTATPPRSLDDLSIFMNLRVTDIRRCYEMWRSRGAVFITEPKVHASEIRCYMRDPDGYLIEVGQTTTTPAPLDAYV